MDLRALRSTAFDRASRHFGDYMAVQLSAGDPEHGLPAAWHVLDFRNAHVLGAWFRDTSGLPYRFAYIAIFDKTAPEWSQGLPIAEIVGTGAAEPAVGRLVYDWDGSNPSCPVCIGASFEPEIAVGADIDEIRYEAGRRAAELPTPWTGIAILIEGRGAHPPVWWTTSFTTKQQMLDWFARETQGRAAYVAIFDKTAPEWAQGLPIADHRPHYSH